MLIPVRCFTCGKVLADKWAFYERRCSEMDVAEGLDEGSAADGACVEPTNAAATPAVVGAGVTARGRLLDELTLTRLCCRRHFLTHVDLLD